MKYTLCVVSLLSLSLFPQWVLAENKDLCGVFCLYIALKSVDLPVESLEKLQEEMGPPPAGGYSLGQIEEVAQKHGAQTLGVQTTIPNLKLRKERFACVAHSNGDHFVILAKIEKEGVLVIDTPSKRMVPFVTWDREWDGTCLLISPQELVREEDLAQPFQWKWLLMVGGLVSSGAIAAMYFRRRAMMGASPCIAP